MSKIIGYFIVNDIKYSTNYEYIFDVSTQDDIEFHRNNLHVKHRLHIKNEKIIKNNKFADKKKTLYKIEFILSLSPGIKRDTILKN